MGYKLCARVGVPGDFPSCARPIDQGAGDCLHLNMQIKEINWIKVSHQRLNVVASG